MSNFQQIWEELRLKGEKTSKYPYDKVISFVFRYYKKLNTDKSKINILEVGCGIGNNLYPLAMEGFNVYGIDGSPTAIKKAKDIFKELNLKGYFIVQDFTNTFDFEDNKFDLIIDRGSITCVDYQSAKKCIKEIYRVLKKGGYFLFNPYSQDHYTFLSSSQKELTSFIETEQGTLSGTGKVCFYNEHMIKELLNEFKFEIQEFKHIVIDDLYDSRNKHAEFEIICRK